MHALMVNDINTLQTQVDLVSKSQKASHLDSTASEVMSNAEDLPPTRPRAQTFACCMMAQSQVLTIISVHRTFMFPSIDC
jgi:hypothetical protein